MNVTDYKEVWQIDAGGQIYEARFEEMAQWIFEGSLLPQDMVRRGNLRWIEARKVPALGQYFNAKDQGFPPPVFATTTDAQGSFDSQTVAPQNFALEQSLSSNPFQATVNQPVENGLQPSQSAFEAAPATHNFQNQNTWQENQFEPAAPQFNEPAAHEFNL